jgi:hypothetical protein
MTTAVLSPLRKQGNVSKVPAAPTAVLLQGSSAPLTATIPRTQGPGTSPTMLACTQGSGTSLPDTLAHSYTPIVHLDPLLASIKGRTRALMRGVAREDGLTNRLTPSPSRALVTESSLVGFGGLDDNPIKGLTSVLSVEQVLNAKLTGFNTSEQV